MSPSCGASVGFVGFPSSPVLPGDQPSYRHHRGHASSPQGASAAGWQAMSHRHGNAWFSRTGGRVLPVHATCPGGLPPATHLDTWRFRPMRWVHVDPASSLPSPSYGRRSFACKLNPRKPPPLQGVCTAAVAFNHFERQCPPPPVAVALPPCPGFPLTGSPPRPHPRMRGVALRPPPPLLSNRGA
jgi:hypothetical protein